MSFTFQSNTIEEFNAGLANLGVIPGNGNEFEAYWRLCMDMLKTEMETVFTALNNVLKQQEPKTNETSPEELQKKYNSFTDAVGKISWTDNDITLSPTQFLNKFFVNCLNVRSLGVKDWRDLYENISPVQQCATAQKRLNAVYDWDVCYICGTTIEDKLRGGEQFTRECEHILPAFTALGFKGLIQSTNIEIWDTIPDDILKFYRYEYANSHRCCNRIKSGIKFIKYNFATGIYEEDLDNLVSVLTNILTSGQHDCSMLVHDKATFVNERTDEINATFIQPLLVLINTQKNKFGNLFDLNIRINQLSALKLNIPQIANAILTGQPPTKVSNLKSKSYNNLQAKNLLKKQLTNPENLFFDAFKSIFSQMPEEIIQQLFSFYFGQELRRGLSRISRKVFELGLTPFDSSFRNIASNAFIEAENKLDELITEDDEMDKENLMAFNNEIKLKLSNKFTEQIYLITDFCLKNRIPLSEDTLPLITEIKKFLNLATMQSIFDNTGLIYQQHQFARDMPSLVESNDTEFSGLITTIQTENVANAFAGGSKKLIKNKKLKFIMKGGTIEEEMIQSYKNDILETAANLGFNPANYGIKIQTTRYGRASKPPSLYTGNNGIKIGQEDFTIDYFRDGIVHVKTNQFIPFTYQGAKKGVVDSQGNFYQTAGKKKKLSKLSKLLKKINKKTMKSKNKYYKKNTRKSNN